MLRSLSWKRKKNRKNNPVADLSIAWATKSTYHKHYKQPYIFEVYANTHGAGYIFHHLAVR
jgi:hypothetical protein